ncbi:butyrophilin-like protein 2 isoform X1 [Enoplosus armatus]|uniref:butyrophilin-like protein 2 isoform X1 n=1 Tax=Enoplosus armatus TaxID=215367 RepID=UPI00399698CF
MVSRLLLAAGLLCCSSGQSSLHGPPEKLLGFAGGDVILPCSYNVTVHSDVPTVEWSKEGLEPDVIFLYRGGYETPEMKNPAFEYRTSFIWKELKDGNISLRISDLKPSDTGKYQCLRLWENAPQDITTVELTVVEPQLIGSLQAIIAAPGDDVILPCHVEPSFNVEGLTVEWSKPDLKPDPSDRLSRVEYVHLYRGRSEDPDMKIQSYVKRTELFADGLKRGNVSLKIKNVTLADVGRYRCFIPKLKSKVKDSVVQLVVALSELICSRQPIVALAGDDVILPCHLDPALSASSETVVWTKPDLDPKYIHVHRDGRPAYLSQNPSYGHRTALFVDELTNGNVSVKIFSVKICDEGKYFCFLHSMQKEASIRLVVGAVSTPIIEVSSDNSGRVVLQCESKGWYPEPEVFWLDGEGNLLSAGPTETVGGPDGLYTVSSRVTVEKRHSNSFTCRVQQKTINRTRETHVHVPVYVFMIPSECPLLCFVLLAVSVAVLACVIVCTRRIQECEKDGQDNLRNAACETQRKPEVVKKHNTVENVYENLPMWGKKKQLEDQREQLDGTERSQREEASEITEQTKHKKHFKIH